MTVPVMMTHDAEVRTKRSIKNITCVQGVEMCFYLTESTQSEPPQPTGEDVYLSQKEMRVYATSVGGYPDHDTQAAKLRAVLEREGDSQVT